MSKNKNQIFKDFSELYKISDQGLALLAEAKEILSGEKTSKESYHIGPSYCVHCGREAKFGNGFCSIDCQTDHWGE